MYITVRVHCFKSYFYSFFLQGRSQIKVPRRIRGHINSRGALSRKIQNILLFYRFRPIPRLSRGYFITAMYIHVRQSFTRARPSRRFDSSRHSVEVFYRRNFFPGERRAFLRGHDIARSFRTEIILPAAYR